MANWIGRQIGKYEIKELLGRGGMGAVYKAFHPALERDVAIKLIHTHLASEPSAVDRFRREARVVAALRHPGIVQVHDFDVEADTFYMVMEFVPGENLRQRLGAIHAQDERLPLNEALNLFRSITQAVAYAHSQNVIHRDLKPANVLLTPDGQPVLADFGLSKIIRSEQLTAQGVVMGTPEYMSPEQSSGRQSDARADVYALGIMLYEMVTGTLPFTGDTPVGILLRHANELPAPPRSINPDLPVAVEHIIQKAVAKAPAERFASAQELLEALEAVMVPQVDTAAETIFSSTDDGRCPYRGLQTFEAEHAEFFFGREALIEQLVGQVSDLSQDEVETGSGRFLAVLGASGSGKSSLVRAGLVPTLQEGAIPGSDRWVSLIMKPGSHPLEELAARLGTVLYSEAERLGATRQLQDGMAADGRDLHLAVRLAWLEAPEEQRLLLVIDQFEEIFTLCHNEAERHRFIENLLYAAGSEGRVIVLLTMRADFYHRCAAYRDLASRLSAQKALLVGPMNEAELRRAIERPAWQVGLRFEPGLVDTILADVAQQPGALPLLQHALLELWERRERGILTLQAYRDSGGVVGAIAQRAETLYANFSPEEQAIVRQVMLRLTQPGEGTEDTRRRARMNEFVGEKTTEVSGTSAVSQVIQLLTDARLLTTTRDAASGEETVDVAHEALIRGWNRLREWIDEDRAALRTHRRLTEAAEEWERNQWDESYLYRGARLVEVHEWAKSHPDDLNEMERAFLNASLASAEAVQRAKEAGRRKRNFFVFSFGVAAITIACLMTGLAGVAIRFALVSEARTVAVSARSVLEDNPSLAILLTLAAQKVVQTDEVNRIIFEASHGYPPIAATLTGHTDGIWRVAFSPDGSQLASGSDDNSIILWDVVSGRPVSTLKGHTDTIFYVAFSPDGSQLASGSMDNTIILWDVTSGQPVSILEGHTDSVWRVAFSPDGSHIVSVSFDNTIILWDVSSDQPVPVLTEHVESVNSVAFSPDGSQLASGSADNNIILWDVTSGQLASTLKGHTDTVNNVAFSPDGNQLASGSADNTIVLWDVTNGQQVSMLKGHTGSVNSVAFSPDGSQLASGSGDGTVVLWDVSNGQSVSILEGHTDSVWSVNTSRITLTATGEVLNVVDKRHTGSVNSVAFSPDGNQLAFNGETNTIILWDVSSGQLVSTLKGHTDRVNSVVFSPDSSQLASGSSDSTIILWDTTSGQPSVATIEGVGNSVWSVAFSPDSGQLAAGTESGTIKFWDVTNGQQISSRSVHTASVNSVAFSPDGSQLASGSTDNTIILWDVSNGQPVSTLKGHTDTVWGVAFSPDGSQLVSAGDSVILWDLASGQPTAIYKKSAKSVAFSPDGSQLAFNGEDRSIILWDVSNGQPVSTLKGHTDAVWGVAFSPDGSQLASGSLDHTIILWDVTSGQPIYTLKGHTDAVWGVAFSPDGQTLASGGGLKDRSIILWDVTTGQQISTLKWHTSIVSSVVFSPDGNYFASGSTDSLTFIADTKFMQPPCQWLTRNLSREEWRQYVSSYLPYREVCPGLPVPGGD